jgi:SAM-dependent methyltransferase
MGPYRRDLAYVHAVGFETWIRGAAPSILRTLRRAGAAPGGLVVDLGCGSGLWVESLQRAGYRALGIDVSSSMVALARRRAPDATFRTGTIAAARLPRCQVVTAFGEVFNYRASRAPGLRALFARVHRALVPGGLFLFDVRGPSPARVPDRLAHALGLDWAVLVRVQERGRGLVRRITAFRRLGRDYRRSDETHRLRLYPRAEVVRALRACGFSVSVRARLGATGLTGNRIAFLARRVS